MSLIGNPDTPASYVADYMQACVGMFGIPAGGFTSDIETYGAATSYDVESLYAAMLNGSIGRAIYAPGSSNESFATKLVDKVGGGLLSAADKAAAVDEVQALLDGGLSHAATAMAVVEFVAGLETSDETYGAVAQQFQNRIEIANYYTFQGTNPSSTLSTLQGVLSTVTNTTDVSDPEAVLNDITEPGVSTGQTFTLTKSVDSITGTTGNDTIIAGDDGGTASLNAGDVIAGGAGTDTIKVINGATANNGAAFTLADITGVEKVLFTAAATTEAIDVSGNADVTEVWAVKGLDSDITLKLTQKAGISGTVATTAAVKFQFASSAGSSDSATLMLDNADTTKGGAGDGVDIQSVETLNIVSTGTNNLGELDSDATKLVLTGAGSFKATLTEAGGGASLVKTVDGSAATGAIYIDNTSAGAAVEDIKTGSGNDTYITLFANLTKDDKINLGTGSNTLGFGDATDLSDATKALVLGGSSNYQAIMVTGGAFAFKADGDALGSSVTKYIADTTGAFTGTNIASGTTLEVGDVALGASTVGMKLGQKVLAVTLAGSKTAISDASAGLTVTGATDVNVASNGYADQGANKLGLTSDDNTTVTITGSQGLTLTTTAATATTGFTIDGSAASGALDLTGTAAADIIKGGSGKDTLRADVATGADVLTGNGGADKFIFASTDIDTTAGAVTATITDFVSGTDSLQFGYGAGSATTYVEATSAASTLTALLTAAGTALDGTVLYYVGQVGSDVYIVSDQDGTGYTDVVKLVGVSLDQIQQGDITA